VPTASVAPPETPETVDVPTAEPTASNTASPTAAAVDVPVAVPTASAAACCADPEMGKAAIGNAAMPKSAI
jgi:hypothetical protein